MDKEIKKELKSTILRFFLVGVLWAVGLSLGLLFFDWKLVLVIFILIWASNLTLIETQISPMAKTIKIILGKHVESEDREVRIQTRGKK